MVKVLDLFAGLRGWSAAFEDRGHEVFSIDLDEKFDVDLHKDIREVTLKDLPWRPDVILASPPCEKFSVMTIGRYWNKDNTPKNEKSAEALALVYQTLDLIKWLTPCYWVMENPRGKLRALDVVKPYERRTVTYCKLGLPYMKPTDLWGGFPESLELPGTCRNGDPCHIAAPRGSTTGVQGRVKHDPVIENPDRWKKPRGTNKFRGGMIEEMARFPSWSNERKALTAERAKIPYKLSELVCLAVEKDMGVQSDTR